MVRVLTRAKQILLYVAALVAPLLAMLLRLGLERLSHTLPTLGEEFGELPRYLFFISAVPFARENRGLQALRF
jgi:hypothetical protein